MLVMLSYLVVLTDGLRTQYTVDDLLGLQPVDGH